jgi:hypothetical protein
MDRMLSKRPTREFALPLALAIGLSPAFFSERVNTVVRGGAVIMPVALAEATEAAFRWRPTVLLVTDDVFSFDPDRFSLLAMTAGAVLAIVGSEDVGEEEVRALMCRALAESAILHRREDVPASAPPPISGTHARVRRSILPLKRKLA